MFDLTVNPWSPKPLFNTRLSGETGRNCHDSYVEKDINGQDILFVSEGNGRNVRLYDVTNVNSTTSARPSLLGVTAQVSGIYAHQSWLSLDKRYLYLCDERNVGDIYVFDVTDVTNPVRISIIQVRFLLSNMVK